MIDELKAWLEDEEFIKKQSYKKICEVHRKNCIKCPLLMGCDEPHFEVEDENKSI